MGAAVPAVVALQGRVVRTINAFQCRIAVQAVLTANAAVMAVAAPAVSAPRVRVVSRGSVSA